MSIIVDSVYLPDYIEQNAIGGPAFKTTILPADSGIETAISSWSQVRHSWAMSTYHLEPAEYEAFKAFFLARRGAARGFLFKDWTDFRMPRQTIGTGNGTTDTFLLTKTYADNVNAYVRTITRPVLSTLKVWVNNVLQESGYAFTSGGIIDFVTPPTNTHVIQAECQFDNPVRFNMDGLQMNVVYQGVAKYNNFEVIELKEY